MVHWTNLDLERQFKRVKSKGWLEAFQAGAAQHNIPLQVLLAIGSRETNMWNILGDGGHGHGIMQIDNRSYPEWCASGKWRDALESIKMGAFVLADKLAKARHVEQNVNEALRIAIASYNAGGHAIKDYLRFKDPDRHTTGHDYSADVLKRAEVFKGLL